MSVGQGCTRQSKVASRKRMPPPSSSPPRKGRAARSREEATRGAEEPEPSLPHAPELSVQTRSRAPEAEADDDDAVSLADEPVTDEDEIDADEDLYGENDELYSGDEGPLESDEQTAPGDDLAGGDPEGEESGDS